MSINIAKNGNDTYISDVYSFTESPMKNEIGINCQSDFYSENEQKKTCKKKLINYSINLDWLQFVALKIVEVDFTKLKSKNFTISERVNRNPNFKQCYGVTKNSAEILEINFGVVNQNCYPKHEVVVKIKNSLLYVNDYISTVNEILSELGLIFWRISRIDIALDGNDILRIMDVLRGYTRNKTIQIGNSNLKVDPGNLNKSDLTFESYRIGNKRCQKSAIVYNKSDEIEKSQKNYIKEFWQLNGIDTEQEIGRFEVQLNYQHLKKYQIKSLEMIMDVNFIGSIFKKEIKDWLKIYRVRLGDIKNHRKDIAIRKGKEIKLFHWDSIPSQMIGISLEDARVNPVVNAKRSTSFSVEQLVNCYLNNDITTGSTLEYITNTTTKFDLLNYAEKKLEQEFDRHEKLNHSDKTFIRDEFKKYIIKSTIKKSTLHYSNS